MWLSSFYWSYLRFHKNVSVFQFNNMSILSIENTFWVLFCLIEWHGKWHVIIYFGSPKLIICSVKTAENGQPHPYRPSKRLWNIVQH